jgi:serine/threonine protein phosphatase PrpC
MEDEYTIADGGRFVAVFDGHGGSGVSQYLKKHLYNSMKRNLHLKLWEETELLHANLQELSTTLNHSSELVEGDNTFGSTDEKPMIPSVSSQVAALRSAFAEMERDVITDDELRHQGSTSVAVVVHESEDGHRTLLSANVGDSRAILSRNKKAVDLTRDHKPNDEREKARILAMGETIEWDRFARVHRVKSLSLSRAIGDRYAKPAVSSEVEIMHYPIIEEDDADEFILLASDGLWDVMSSADVVQFVHSYIEKELMREIKYQQIATKEDEDFFTNNYKFVLRKSMAKHVAREAIRRGSADNVCVVMVWLSDLKKSSDSSRQKEM